MFNSIFANFSDAVVRAIKPMHVLSALLLLLLLAAGTQVSAAEPQQERVPASVNNGYSGADYWREVNHGASGYTPAQGKEQGVLINRTGEQWRQVRNQQVKPIGGWVLAGTLLALFLVYLVVGKNRLDQPRTGVLIERWKRLDRFLHWLVAGLFLILAVTGLSILYGRHFLPDLLGSSGFGTFLAGCKLAHNYLGPLFVVALLLMILKWVRHNVVNGHDLRWFLEGGGMIKGKHPHAGYMNGGEKAWFWVLTLGGILISLSGLVLDFPAYTELREDFQLANLIHGIASIVVLCAAFGHIYIGTFGTEGALEGMVNGQVDETWAKQHHDLWYQQLQQQAQKENER